MDLNYILSANRSDYPIRADKLIGYIQVFRQILHYQVHQDLLPITVSISPVRSDLLELPGLVLLIFSIAAL